MMGRLSENTFLRLIRYREHWPYDIWPSFKPTSNLSMNRGIPLIAIDGDPSLSLAKRDHIAAKKILATFKQYPHYTFLVYTGQMHVTPSHLPAAFERVFSRSKITTPKRVIVYQNAEEIYWRLAKERQEGVEVVKVNV